MTMRCSPIITMLDSSCWRLRAITARANGTSASAALDVVRVKVLDGEALDLRFGHMEVAAQVPVGGIDCGSNDDPTEILLFAMVVVIIGGLGSIQGAAVGAVLIGLIDAFSKAWFPEFSYFTIFAPRALVLVFRPYGLFGRPS